MDDFADFMKNPVNRIASASQHTPGIEGYVYDGADGSQMAFWTCREHACSTEHVHVFDEYIVVVRGCYTLFFADGEVRLRAGEEHWIPRGVPHAGEAVAGTRTIHAFGGKRAERSSAKTEKVP